jgi:hypothetical protein
MTVDKKGPLLITKDDHDTQCKTMPERKGADAGTGLFDLFGRPDLLIPEGLADQTHEPVLNDTRGCPPGWRTFFSAPYVVTELLPGVVSVVLLSAYVPSEAHVQALARNVGATKLSATLVLARGSYWRLEPGRELMQIAVPPAARLWWDQGIPHTYKMIGPPERFRWYNLYIFGRRFEESDLGDLEAMRVGRLAGLEDVERLSGPDRDGIPHGLLRCEKCGEYRGEYLDTVVHSRPIVVRVYCQCENDNRSPIDGELLSDRKLDANYFDEATQRVRFKSPTDVMFRRKRERTGKVPSEVIQ